MFNTSMFMPRYLIKRTYEASEIHEREDGNMSGFLLALPAQTGNRALKADSPRDKQCDRDTRK